MELDIRLERGDGKPWGFRLIGGKGVDLPLTIIEVLPKSPAEKSGLQNGDAIAKIGGKSTDNLTLEEALLLVDEAKDCLCIGILRGLYDPVIDDQDPVFEEPGDFDRRSEPTEVSFKIQNFDDPSQGFGPHYVYDEDGNLVETNFLGESGFLDNDEAHYVYANPANFNGHDFIRGMSLEPYSDGINSINGRGSLGFRESRSLTASPFSVSSKSYRPFSTEPLKEIPPVEDPIILNPDYKDDFGYKFDERGVESVLDLPKVEPNFKLPKSEKYDPNWKENNKTLEEKLAQSIKINKIMNERLRKSAELVLKEINNYTSTEFITGEKKEIFESEKKCNSKKINISSWELSDQFKREVLEVKKKLKEEVLMKEMEIEGTMKQHKTLKTIEMKQIKKEKEYGLNMNQEIDINQIEKTTLTNVDENFNTVENLHKDLLTLDVYSESTNTTQTQKKVISEHNASENVTSSKEVTESLQIIKENNEVKKGISEDVKKIHTMDEELINDSIEVRSNQEVEKKHEELNNITTKVIEEGLIESHNQEYECSKVIKRKSFAADNTPALNNVDETFNSVEDIHKDLHTADAHSENTSISETQRKMISEPKTREDVTSSKQFTESLQIMEDRNELKKETSENVKKTHTINEELKTDSVKVSSKKEVKKNHEELKNLTKETKPFEDSLIESHNEEYERSKVIKRKSFVADHIPALNIEDETDNKEYIKTSTLEHSETISDEKIIKQPINDNSKEQCQLKHKEVKITENNMKQQTPPEGMLNETQTTDDKRTDTGHRVYTIGLQTIPNIRGVVHSQHYDLLLKTFFIHLTDVMVALSRFMLTKPVFSETVRGNRIYESEIRKADVKETGIEQRSEQRKGSYVDKNVQREAKYSSKQSKQEISEDSQQRKEQENYIERKLAETEMMEKKVFDSKEKAADKLSQKSKEVSQKMDKVITEFQNKTEEIRRIRRSSSRSSIEEEVALESDPLEWLDKVSSRRSSQEFSEINKNQFSESKYESKRESKQESRQIKMCRSKPGRQIYRAIVEAHVYTNPDVIFEDHTAEILESATFETAESTNLAIESNQVAMTENIAVENAVSQETSTAKELKGHTFSRAQISNQATVESYEENLHDVNNLELMNLKQNAIQRQVENIKDIVVQETKDVIEPIVNFKSESRVVKQATATKQEMLVQTAAERTELNETSKHELLDVKEFKAENADITRDNFTAIEINEIDAISNESTELKLTKDKTAEAKKSLEIADTRALEITEVAIETDSIDDLIINKTHEAIATKAIDEINALQVSETVTDKEDFGVLKLESSKEATANKIIEEADAVQISEVNIDVDEVAEFKIGDKKEITAKQSFEEAKSIIISETLADNNEMSSLNVQKTKEANAVTLLEEGNAAVQISEVIIEKDEIKEIKIRRKNSEIAQRSIQETSALEVSVINTELAKEEIKDLTIAKNKKFVADKAIQEATAIQVAEYKSQKDEVGEFEVDNKHKVTAFELTEDARAKAEINEVIVERDFQIETAAVETPKMKTEKIQDEFAELKIIKHQDVNSEYTDELDSAVEITEVTDIDVRNEFEGHRKIEESLYKVSEINTDMQSEYAALNLAKQQILGISEFTFDSSMKINTSSDTQLVNQTIINENKQLEINEALQEDQQTVIITEVNQSPERTSSPDVPTPLVDEYVFKLEIPLPKGITPVPPDPSPVEEKVIKMDEDPHIVKKKLIPHIDLSIESAVFDPPLSSPEVKVCSPVYRKPGLRGGADRPEYRKADIREIERKSSLLKSAIDQTIKSIEEYKEELGMESKKEIKIEKSAKSESVTFSSMEKNSNGIEEELGKPGLLDEKISELISGEINSSAENTKQVESSDVKNISNGLDITEPLQETKANEETSKETKFNLPNGDIIDNSLNEVEKHVDDIKKIVQNTDNIANLTESNKIKTESKPMENNESMKIEETEIKKDIVNETTKEIKIESKNATTAGDVTEITENNSEVLKEEIKTQEVGSDILKTEDLTQKPDEISKDIEKVAKENKDETSEVDLEVKEVLKGAEVKLDPLLVIKPVEFHPENIRSSVSPRNVPVLEPLPVKEPYKTDTGEIIGTIQGIVDGLEDAVVDEEVAKELGKPGLPDEKIAELISGEAEMLREAHVMGLSRVISSHMHREVDSSVDFEKIKPLVESLKDSEVLKALNEELMRTREEKRKEERRWTTFLQKPTRPVPKAKTGYPGYLYREIVDEEPYKVKIVKQPKPKVAPDYKPEDFDTGPLPWEEREQIEAAAPPPNLVPEEPILVPEEAPEFLEAVDPLPESEVPDLEDTGIPLPPPPPLTEEPLQLPVEEVRVEETQPENTTENVIEESSEETMDNNLVENLIKSVHNMVDPNASLEQQLAQMQAQLKALAELPGVIQQTLELVTRQLFQFSHQQNSQQNAPEQIQSEHVEQNYEVIQSNEEVNQSSEVKQDSEMNGEAQSEELRSYPAVEEMVEPQELKHELSQEEIDMMKREEEEMIEEQKRTEKQKKEFLQAKLEQESRQLKQRPTPRVGKPKPVFGPLNPQRPVVLPGGRRWRGPKDAYNEELIKETLTAQAELIQGKVLGFKYESDKLPFDERVNFMKYEKPPVSLEHLKNSEVYKLIHDMDDTPVKRVDMLTPVIAEADYRERCRSRTPNIIKPHNVPQQLMP